MENISLLVIIVLLLCIAIILILLYPSRAVYLLAFTIPLSPYIALSESAYAGRGYILFNLNDLLVAGIFLSIFLSACLKKRATIKYPLLKPTIAVLTVYFCLLVFIGLARPANQFMFNFFYLLRYSLYFLIGLYVWKYLSVKDIEKYIMILLAILLVNSTYGIYEFVDSLLQGRYQMYGTTPRVSGVWGLMFGAEGIEQDIADPGNFGMYLLISLVVGILYIFYKKPKPGGFKKHFAIVSLIFGFIALHMTMSRAPIYAFWGVFLYLMVFEGRTYFKMKVILAFSLISLAGVFIIYYHGIDIGALLTERLYTVTSSELTFESGRYALTADIVRYLSNNFVQWWGHGLSSFRLYVDELDAAGLIRYRSGSLYNGYLSILWDAGLIGIFVWAYWIKKHFTLFARVKKRVCDIDWFAVALKGILIGFLIAMLSAEYMNNFRLMGYFSFLTGILLKYTYQNHSVTVAKPGS